MPFVNWRVFESRRLMRGYRLLAQSKVSSLLHTKEGLCCIHDHLCTLAEIKEPIYLVCKFLGWDVKISLN